MFERLATNGYDCEDFELKRDKAFEFIKKLVEEGYIYTPGCNDNYISIKNTRPFYKYGEGACKYAFFDIVPGYVVKINRHISDFISVVREAMVYKKAIDENISSYFAHTYYVGTIDNIAITIQECVDVDCDFNEDVSYNRISKLIDEGELQYDYDCYVEENKDNGWSYCTLSEYRRDRIESMQEEDEIFIEAFVENEAEKVIRFLNDYTINDIHQANFGFRDTNDLNTFVLIDFSGFHEWRTYKDEFVNEEYYDDICRTYECR